MIEIPFCVDLDGTLLRMDSRPESFYAASETESTLRFAGAILVASWARHLFQVEACKLG